MAKFTTRVELHNSEDADYDKLHKTMRKEGFSQKIIVKNKKVDLPLAEYNKRGDFTKEDVLHSAQKATEKVSKYFSILVTKSDGRIILQNLPK